MIQKLFHRPKSSSLPTKKLFTTDQEALHMKSSSQPTKRIFTRERSSLPTKKVFTFEEPLDFMIFRQKIVTRRELKFLTRAFLLCYFIFDIFHLLISHYISHFISHYISFVIIMCLQDIYLYSLLFH
jgi:hypothetical protein